MNCACWVNTIGAYSCHPELSEGPRGWPETARSCIAKMMSIILNAEKNPESNGSTVQANILWILHSTALCSE